MKTFAVISSILTLGLTGLTSLAQATPIKFTSCPVQRQIRPPENSAGFYMNEDCTVAYILPPQLGSLQVSAYAPSVHKELCATIINELDSASNGNAAMRSAEAALERKRKSLEKFAEELERSRTQIEKTKMALVNLKATKSSLEQKLQQRNTSLASQQAESEECKKNPPKDWDERARCADLKSKIWDDKGAILDLQGTLEDITSKIADLQPKVEQSQAWLEEKNNQYQVAMTDLQNDLDRLETQRDGLYRKVSQLTKDSAKTAGATMSVVFLSKHQDLIRQFQELNKDLNVSFVPMPIKASLLTVSSTRKGIDGIQSESNSIILESQISGLKTRNEFDESIPEVSLINGGETSSSILFGQAAGGKMVINRLAACEIQRKIKNQDDAAQAAAAISNLFAPTVTYKYEMQVGASIRYRYREDHLYQLIRRHTQSNGLFRTRSSQSLLESGQYNKWIDIEITSQDSEHRFSNPLEIANDFRARKLDEALMKVATSYSQGITPPALGEAPRSGASKLIEEGNRCSFLFCRYSTLTLKIGDALFGGQTAESEMQRSLQASATETIDIKDMVSEIGTMSLTTKSN